MKRINDDTWIFFNIVVCLLCLTYLYYRLDKDVEHVYKYAKSLDSDMVRMLNDIEGRYAKGPIPTVFDASSKKLP